MTDSASEQSLSNWQRIRRDPLDSFALLLVLTVLTILLLGLVDLRGEDFGEALVTILAGATLVLGLRASNAPRGLVVAAAVLAVLTVAGHLVFLFVEAEPRFNVLGPGWFLLTVVTPLFVLARVFRHPRVTLETIFGVICVYLLAAIAFAYLFIWISAGRPGDFFGTSEPTTAFMYFSLVTISTLGYGDLAPVQDFGRIVAGFEAVLGQVFLVTVVAYLVSLYSPRLRRSEPTGDPDVESSS